MTEEQETAIARMLHANAIDLATSHAEWRDIDAATIALLVRALELATPGWSCLGRASLFTGADE